ncbi:hypothetical protein [Halobellus ordinarius]|uniref:hypothetical protein n=1 Tax=Halobellus ordinarius TaxID=3075120 RepID=UPI00288072DE|nr:hypothetical protein [Halobellus sp. ZY16]
MTPTAHPQWGLVGVGQAGTRIVSTYLERTGGVAVADRFLFATTNRAGPRRTLDRVASELPADAAQIAADHLVTFGQRSGVGSDFVAGKRAADSDFEALREGITTALDGADSVVYPLGLGGGTGNGTVPYLIDRLSRVSETDSPPAWLAGLTHFALGVWPFEHESSARHFNAICGLSRLLARDDGAPNADMTLLASNSRLRELASTSDGSAGDPDHSTKELPRINDLLVAALELFVGAGQGSGHVVTGSEFADVPQQRGIAHATFGTALGKPVGLDVSHVIDRAVENAFVPLDPTTAGAAYAVVRAPAARVEAGDVTSGRVQEAFATWAGECDLRNTAGTTKLLADPDKTGLDALVVLGGFDLDPLLASSWERYERVKAELRDSEHREPLDCAERAETTLDRYQSG